MMTTTLCLHQPHRGLSWGVCSQQSLADDPQQAPCDNDTPSLKSPLPGMWGSTESAGRRPFSLIALLEQAAHHP